jgi:short-subunit dehydrogenase
MFKNKNIIITGASSGLGKALALKLADLGANLFLASRRIDLLEALKAQLNLGYPEQKIHVLKSDVTVPKDSENLVQQSVAYFGSLDIFIANAGQSMWSRFRDLKDPKELQDLMQLNYMGVASGLFYALPHLRKNKGSFVAISSIQGALPVPFHSGYVAAKYAVTGFIDTVRLEEPEVHFLLAMPSWVAGTELRAQALKSTAPDALRVKEHHDKAIISAERCADYIINALDQKRDKIYIPKKYQYIPILRSICQRMVDNIILKRVKKQLNA